MLLQEQSRGHCSDTMSSPLVARVAVCHQEGGGASKTKSMVGGDGDGWTGDGGNDGDGGEEC